jgi:hypothetical protein
MSRTRGTIALYIYHHIYIYILKKKNRKKEGRRRKRDINAEMNGESDHLGINIIKSHLQINDNKVVCFTY